MKVLEEHTVPANIDDIKIYDYCVGLFDQLPSRKSVKKAIDKGEILLNNDRTITGWWLKGGEGIKLVDLEQTPPKAYKKELNVLFEDEHLAIIFKPAGLLTSGNAFKTAENAAQFNLSLSKEKDALKWPQVTHRLDKQTSGLLIFAKTKTARKLIGDAFEEGAINKTYHAIVLGKLEGEGEYNNPIQEKESKTIYSAVQSAKSPNSNFITLVKLEPKTGRTHQLRIHLSNAGHAILGDPLYSPENLKLKHKGLFLTANQLEFDHPISYERIKIGVDLPKKFQKRLEYDEKRWKSAYLD